MPYISKSAREKLDPRIDDAIRTIRGEEIDGNRAGYCRTILKQIARMVSEARGSCILLCGNDTNVERLAKTIFNDFTPDARMGVLNYVFTRVIVGSFVQTYPMHARDWSYHSIATVLAVFERTKLELFGNGVNDLVLSALEAAKMEFYCRIAVPKERAARISNTDIKEYIEPDVFP